MTGTSLMSLGKQAMFANYAALQSTGHNIANANVAGYSRQQVELRTVAGQSSSAGYFGRGVDVASVTRLHDEFLTREAAASRAIAAGDASYSKQLQQLEAILRTGEAGIGHAVGELFNAFADVASKPQDVSARQVVLARIDEAATRMRLASEQLSGLQGGVNLELKTSVAAVNSLTRQIAGLNQEIATQFGSGHAPNDLLDARDQAVSELSGYLHVSTIAADDGTLSVFMGSGQNLVLSNLAVELTAVADTFDPQRLQLGIRQAGIDGELSPSLLTGGSIAGLLRFQNGDLVDARNQLGRLATAVSDQLNRQQALGLDLNQNAGGALLKTSPPQVLASRFNSGSASIEVRVADSSELRASDYELSRDSAGSYSLRRLADNHLFGPPELPPITPAALAAGLRVDGITVQLGSGPEPAVGDRFLLQPVAIAARDIALALADPRGIAAAAPVVASVSSSNAGTLSVDQLKVLAPVASAPPEVLLRFDIDPLTQASTYTWSSDGGATYSSPPQPLQPNQPISDPLNPSNPTWSLALRGAPAAGDVVRVQPTLISASNNGNANQLLSLRDARAVGAQVDNASGAIRRQAGTFSDAWAEMLSHFGVRVQSARTVASQSATVAEAAQSQKSNASGVNLDEEAARMLQFQQSYQAAAKMLQVAQAVFDTLLQATGR